MVVLNDEFLVRPIAERSDGGEREFVRSVKHLDTGLELSVIARYLGGDAVTLELDSMVRTSAGNGVIEGTDLPGGAPVVNASAASMTLRLKLGEWSAVMTPGGSDSKILMLFKVERVES